MKLSKRKQENANLVNSKKSYQIGDAIDILKQAKALKFEPTVDLQMKLTADPNASTQVVRGTTSLPHGTGKQIRVVVLTKDEKGQAAKDAGADFVGGIDMVNKIAGGWLEFDVVVASPMMMRDVGKLGKILGPRGLMPSPKAGTVTEDIAQAVMEIKKGRFEFKMDKQCNLHCAIGKLSFDKQKLVENASALLSAVAKAKPKDVRGNLIASVSISSTMGPGLVLDKSEFRESEAKE